MNRLDTDTATIIGLWVGIGGFITGIAGVGLTLYSFYKKQPDILVLTASGWFAVVIFVLAGGFVGYRLVRLAASQTQQIANLSSTIANLEQERHRLITISEYLASKSIRQATPRKTKPIIDETKSEAGNDHQV